MTKKYIFICFFIILVTTFGCKESQNKYLIPNAFSKFIATVNNDYVSIPIDSLSLYYYQKHSILKINDNYFLYGYNHMTHSIDIFNITKRKLVRHIPLEKQGPNGIIQVYGLNVLDSSNIYVIDQYKLKCLNNFGDITSWYTLNYDDLSNNLSGYFIQFNEARFNITQQNDTFIGYFIDSRIRGDNREKGNLTHPIIGTINLSKGIVEFLPIYYSDFILNNNGDFSSEITPNITFCKDKILFGFPVESNIFAYDRLSGSTRKFGGASKFCSNLAKRYSSDQNYNFRNEGTWFNSLNYDSIGNYYYRTHWGNQPKSDQYGKLTDGSTKPGYIMIFDKEFKIIDEIKLRDDLWLEDNFATSEGLFFWPKIDRNYPIDTLRLGRYVINIHK